MSFLSSKGGYSSKIELKSKYCIDSVLEPLISHITLRINGSLTSEDFIRTVVNMAVNKSSIHSVRTYAIELNNQQCQTLNCLKHLFTSDA